MSIRHVLLLLCFSIAACADDDGGMGPADDGNEPRPEMVVIPAGTFAMGQTGISGSEPVHDVTFSHDLLVAATEVSFATWTTTYEWAIAHGYVFDGFESGGRGAMGGHRTGYEGPHEPSEPVVKVTWYDVVLWCNARSEREGLTPCYYDDAAHSTVYRSGRHDLDDADVDWDADGYRLPTEAEWEYACRAGTTTLFSWGDGADGASIDPYAWWEQNSVYHTRPVGEKQPNAWGLHDMHGNVYEWVWDYYGTGYYDLGAVTDPHGPATGNAAHDRLIRGGGCDQPSAPLRSAHRTVGFPGAQAWNHGFRFVRNEPQGTLVSQ
jgi:formylglycine-generating enzyme required for sulfatase activity